MENLAFLHASAAYEDPSEAPALRSLEEMGLTVNPAMLGVAAGAVGLMVLSNPTDAQALVGYGDTGSAVSSVQSFLGISADGVFGPETESAVIDFQYSEGLSPDGVVGPSTAAAMGLSGPAFGYGDGEGEDIGGGGGRITVSTNGSPLTVRSGPGTGYAAIDYLSNGTTVGVVDYYNGWYEISGGGWVAGAWTVEGGGSGDGGGGGQGGSGSLVVATNGSELIARSGPGLGYSDIGAYANGSVVRFYDYYAGWYETDLGWVSSAWVYEL